MDMAHRYNELKYEIQIFGIYFVVIKWSNDHTTDKIYVFEWCKINNKPKRYLMLFGYLIGSSNYQLLMLENLIPISKTDRYEYRLNDKLLCIFMF